MYYTMNYHKMNTGPLIRSRNRKNIARSPFCVPSSIHLYKVFSFIQEILFEPLELKFSLGKQYLFHPAFFMGYHDSWLLVIYLHPFTGMYFQNSITFLKTYIHIAPHFHSSIALIFWGSTSSFVSFYCVFCLHILPIETLHPGLWIIRPLF